MTPDEKLIWSYASGTTELQYVSVVMKSRRFVIFKIAGHRYWSDVMHPSVYQPVQYILIRRGVWCLRGIVPKEWTGRVSKKVLKAALDEAERTTS